LITLPWKDRVAAVCEDENDGTLWLTSDLEAGDGTGLEGYQPLEGFKSAQQKTNGSTLIGGRLPPRASRAEVRDAAGGSHVAELGKGVWLALLPGAGSDGTVFRDPLGVVVPLTDPPRDWGKAERWAIRITVTIGVIVAVLLGFGLPLPVDEGIGRAEQELGVARQSKDPEAIRRAERLVKAARQAKPTLPAVALGSEDVLRVERTLAFLFGVLLLLVLLVRGGWKGELPVELSARGARYEETREAAGASEVLVDDLVRRIGEQEGLAKGLGVRSATVAEETAGELEELAKKVEALQEGLAKGLGVRSATVAEEETGGELEDRSDL
jgi:hypothetical protein